MTEKRRPRTADRNLGEKLDISLTEKMMQEKRQNLRHNYKSQEEEAAADKTHYGMNHAAAEEARMQKLEHLLSRLGTLTKDAQPERSSTPDGPQPRDSNNRCSELVNQFCDLDALFKEHAQKNLKRSPLQKSSLHDRKLPKRHDHEIQHPQLVTSDKKPVAANNISMDTRLETAIEQLMDATKSHLLDKKMEVQRLEDTSERALKELETVKLHEEQLLRNRLNYLEHQYRERVAQLEEEFALRTTELRQSAVAQITAFKQKSENVVLAKVEALLLELNGMKSARSRETDKITAATSYLQNKLKQVENNTSYFNHEGLYCSRSHETSTDEDILCSSAPYLAKDAKWSLGSTGHKDLGTNIAQDMDEVFSKTHSAIEDKLKAPKTQLKASKLLFRPLRVSFGPSRTTDFQGEDLQVETISPQPKSTIVLPLKQKDELA